MASLTTGWPLKYVFLACAYVASRSCSVHCSRGGNRRQLGPSMPSPSHIPITPTSCSDPSHASPPFDWPRPFPIRPASARAPNAGREGQRRREGARGARDGTADNGGTNLETDLMVVLAPWVDGGGHRGVIWAAVCPADLCRPTPSSPLAHPGLRAWRRREGGGGRRYGMGHAPFKEAHTPAQSAFLWPFLHRLFVGAKRDTRARRKFTK